MAAPGKRGLETAEEVPAKLSALNVAETKLSSFLQWCKERKFNVSPKVCVERERACAQYGMVATEDIPGGEVLFCIPRPFLLSPETSTIAHILQQGLREKNRLPLKVQPKESAKGNARRCKEFRERLKENDPERAEQLRQEDLVRSRTNRSRQKTEEELERQRELTKQRVQKYRARRKEEKEAEARETAAAPSSTRPRQTRAAVQRDDDAIKAQRAKWAAEKRAQRATWNGNKWNWHKSKNLAAYHARRSDASSSTINNNAEGPEQPTDEPQLNGSPLPNTCQTSPAQPIMHTTPRSTGPEDSCFNPDFPLSPHKTPAAVRKAFGRAKKKIFTAIKSPSLASTITKLFRTVNKTYAPSVDKETPESKKVKTAVYQKLKDLKSRRDKKSLAHRKLLMETVSPANNSQQSKHSPYKRKQINENTAAAVAFLEDVAVDMPGKKTVSKRGLQQKKVLPKRLKRLHRDFSSQQGAERVSLRTMYRHLPKHVKTVKHQGYRQCL